MRQSGYYWVKIYVKSQWVIGEYSKKWNRWFMQGTLEHYIDSDFYKIDERKIERS